MYGESHPFKAYILVLFSKSTEWCSHHHKSVLEPFHHLSKIPHSHLQLIPVPTYSPRQPLTYFLSTNLPYLNISYK